MGSDETSFSPFAITCVFICWSVAWRLFRRPNRKKREKRTK